MGQMQVDDKGNIMLPPAAEKMKELMSHPLIGPRLMKMGKAASDPEFTKAAMSITKNPRLKWMYGILLVYIIAYMLLKRRLLAATDRFLPRLMIRMALFGFFFLGYFLIGYGILGEPFLKVVSVFGSALRG